MQQPILKKRTTRGAEIRSLPGETYSLVLPPGGRTGYRLAQLDDYTGRRRIRFPWKPPVEFSLCAAVAAPRVPGTWGFGLWNAPMQFSLGLGRDDPLPALPQAAWFFYAPPQSHLSFRDDLPGQGLLAQTFRSTSGYPWAILPAAIALPLVVFRPIARRIRRYISRHLIRESGTSLEQLDPGEMHEYSLHWGPDGVTCRVDGSAVHETGLRPSGPLGMVIWIDNQYAAFRPDGSIGYGLLPSAAPQQLEISALRVNGREALIESRI